MTLFPKSAEPEGHAAQPPASQCSGLSSVQIELMDLLSFIYLRHGLPDKAAVLLAARNELAPDEPETLLRLAVALVRSAKHELALETLEELAMMGAADASFHLVRAQALQALGRTSDAANAMRACISLRAVQPSKIDLNSDAIS